MNSLSYSTFKTVVTRYSLAMYFVAMPREYTLAAVTDTITVQCRLTDSAEIADFEENYKSTATEVCNVKEAEILAKLSAGALATRRSAEGYPIVAAEKPAGTKITLVTHNWCDKTTWYTRALRVVAETAQANQTYTVYSLSHQFVIDTYHGKIFQEDFLKDASNNSYRVVVKVNGVTKTEQDPHYGSGGDYTINYAAGTVTFLSALTAQDVVEVTYHYSPAFADDPNCSRFELRPAAGKKLKIDIVEVQFATDVAMLDSVRFQPVANGNPVGDALVYKTMYDLLADSVKSYPEVSAMGGDNWRAIPVGHRIFNWDYVARTVLISEPVVVGINLYLEHGCAFTGTYATVTFYCTSDDMG